MKNKVLEKPQYPSGVYSALKTSFPSFQAYIAYCRELIEEARFDLNTPQREKILFANSPFEHVSSAAKRGILLLHGLYDSPCMVRSIGDYFAARGFIVRAMLLPGHGTVPGDLLHVTYQDWIACAEYGLSTFIDEVDELYVGGFSTGGALATYLALKNPTFVRASFLWAPSFVLSPALRLLARFHKQMNWLLPHSEWLTLLPEIDYAKYSSFCVNSLYQVNALGIVVRKMLATQPLESPGFWVMTEHDEVIRAKSLLKLFQTRASSASELIYYSPHGKFFSDSRVTWRSSQREEQHIVDFSHVALPIAPSHFHYGVHGDFQQVLMQELLKRNKTPCKYGSLKNINLSSRDSLVRLTYNPDFDYMTQRMDEFLGKVL